MTDVNKIDDLLASAEQVAFRRPELAIKAVSAAIDKGNSKYLNQLFPFGPAKQACRYAGLPKPTGCV